MTRAFAGLVVAAVLLVTVFAAVELRTDAASVFGDAWVDLGGDALETAAGRSLIVAVVDAAPDRRNEAARAIRDAIAGDELVATTSLGPAPPSREVLAWLFRHRLLLAPPAAADLEPEALALELDRARTAMATIRGQALGEWRLLDPSGSFLALVERLRALAPDQPHRDGVWQARDGTAALLFVTLADVPFDPRATGELVARIRAVAGASTGDVLVVGPRAIAAETSQAIVRASVTATVTAFLLLMMWLAWTLRSATALAATLLPLALALLVATLVVQAVFGAVHVMALGFGGALTGLALDYPLHLISHRGRGRRRARHVVLLGAATTAITFLAVLGSGLPALAQVGVFVATGLGTAAVAGLLLVPRWGLRPRSLPLERLVWPLPGRRVVEVGLIAGGVAVFVVGGSPAPAALAGLQPQDRADIEALARMVELESSRYALQIAGADEIELLARAQRLAPVLDTATADGLLGGWRAAAALVPPPATQRAAVAGLPDAAAMASRYTQALQLAGMNAEFAPKLTAAWVEARRAAVVTTASLGTLPPLRPLVQGLVSNGDGYRETVRLVDVRDPSGLAAAVAAAAIPGVQFSDLTTTLAHRLAQLQNTVVGWLALGAGGAFIVLAACTRPPALAFGLALTTAAALGATACLLVLIDGPIGVFQVVALTLVFGIGVDYGLFLAGTSGRRRHAAVRSVSVCATSTLIAFTVLAVSPSPVLSDVGLTVSVGIVTLLILHLAQPLSEPESRT